MTERHVRAWIDRDGRIRCMSQMCAEDGGCPRMETCEVMTIRVVEEDDDASR